MLLVKKNNSSSGSDNLDTYEYLADLPTPGRLDTLYYITYSDSYYRWNGSTYLKTINSSTTSDTNTTRITTLETNQVAINNNIFINADKINNLETNATTYVTESDLTVYNANILSVINDADDATNARIDAMGVVAQKSYVDFNIGNLTYLLNTETTTRTSAISSINSTISTFPTTTTMNTAITAEKNLRLTNEAAQLVLINDNKTQITTNAFDIDALETLTQSHTNSIISNYDAITTNTTNTNLNTTALNNYIASNTPNVNSLLDRFPTTFNPTSGAVYSFPKRLYYNGVVIPITTGQNFFYVVGNICNVSVYMTIPSGIVENNATEAHRMRIILPLQGAHNISNSIDTNNNGISALPMTVPFRTLERAIVIRDGTFLDITAVYGENNVTQYPVVELIATINLGIFSGNYFYNKTSIIKFNMSYPVKIPYDVVI